MQKTIELPRQVRNASVRANSYDEAANTIDVIWTTGATVRRASWSDGPYDEKLLTGPENVRLDRLNAGASFLDTHDSYQLASVIGSVVPNSARMVDGQGVAKVALSRAAGCADIVQNLKDGIIRNISVGYIDHAVEKVERDDGSVPLWTVTDWEPFEISAVPVPADAGAQVRSGGIPAGAEVYPCRMTQPDHLVNMEGRMADAPKAVDPAAAAAATSATLAAPGVAAASPQAQAAAAEAIEAASKVKNLPKDATAVVDPGDASPIGSAEEVRRLVADAVSRALAEERTRAADIMKEGDRFGMRALAEEHIRGNTKPGAFRKIVLDELAARGLNQGGARAHGATRRAHPWQHHAGR